MFKYLFILSFTFTLFSANYLIAAPLLPKPWNVPTSPYPSGSCKSCSIGSEIPSLDQQGQMLLKLNLMTYSPVPSSLLKIQPGVTTSFFPASAYVIIPPKTKEGQGNTTMVELFRRRVLFNCPNALESIANAVPCSSNRPGLTLRCGGRKGRLIVLDLKTRIEYVFEKVNDKLWRLEGMRNADYPERYLKCEYNAGGLIKKILLPGNLKYSIRYSDGLVKRVEDPYGAVTRVYWDEFSHIKRITTRRAGKVATDIHLECDKKGRLVSVINTSGEKYTAEYLIEKNEDKKFKKVTGIMTLPDGRKKYNETTWFFDKEAPFQKTIERGIIAKGKKDILLINYQNLKSNIYSTFKKFQRGQTTIYERNEKTNAITSFTNPLDQTKKYIYNQQGLYTSATYPDGSSVSRSYDSMGRLIRKTDELNRPTTYTYTEGRLTKIDEAGIATFYEYDPKGRPEKTILPDGTVHFYKWDDVLRMTSHTRPNKTKIVYQYAKGMDTITKMAIFPAEKSKKAYVRDYFYDQNLRLLKISYQDKTTETFKYDCCNLVYSKDKAGAITKYVYDAGHRKVRATTPNGDKTRYKYDQRDRIVKITYPDSLTTLNKYDENDNLTKRINPDKTAAKYKYNALGKRIAAKFSDNTFSKYKYDLRDRLLSISGNHSNNITYKYSLAGETLRVINYGLPAQETPQTTKYVFDSSKRLFKTILPDTSVMKKFYITDTRKLSGSLHLGVVTRYRYDFAGRVAAIARHAKSDTGTPGAFENNVMEKHSYDKFGYLNEIYRRYDDGSGTPQPFRLVTKYNYRPDGELLATTSPTTDNDALAYLYRWSYVGEGRKKTVIFRKLTEAPEENIPATPPSAAGIAAEARAKAEKVIVEKAASAKISGFSTGPAARIFDKPEKDKGFTTGPAARIFDKPEKDKGFTTGPASRIFDKPDPNIGFTTGPAAKIDPANKEKQVTAASMKIPKGAVPWGMVISRANRTLSSTDRLGNTTKYIYSNGRLRNTLFNGEIYSSYAYNAEGRIKAVKDILERIHGRRYDHVGRLITSIRPDNQKQNSITISTVG
jgi:YD repeat-containing protein